jgi:hypothetical protein
MQNRLGVTVVLPGSVDHQLDCGVEGDVGGEFGGDRPVVRIDGVLPVNHFGHPPPKLLVALLVVSDTLTEADLTWSPATLVRGADLLDTVAGLRDQPGDGYLSVSGSAQVARTLLTADLVDELLLLVEPIVLGGGKTIFASDGEARRFELLSSQTATTGVLINRYQRVR